MTGFTTIFNFNIL